MRPERQVNEGRKPGLSSTKYDERQPIVIITKSFRIGTVTKKINKKKNTHTHDGI